MKKVIITALALSLVAGPVLAAPNHKGHDKGRPPVSGPAQHKPIKHHGGKHHAPQPQYVVHKHHSGNPVGYLFAGLIGSVIGNYIVNANYQPAYNDDVQCFTLISRSTGTTVEKCVSNSTIQRNGIYNVLYID